VFVTFSLHLIADRWTGWLFFIDDGGNSCLVWLRKVGGLAITGSRS